MDTINKSPSIFYKLLEAHAFEFHGLENICWVAIQMPPPRLGEINTPRTMDTVEGCSLYDGLMIGNLPWSNRTSIR
jgi:hypothetical protein